MSIFKQYETDKTAEVEGVPVVVGSNDDGSDITFIVSRIGKSNKAYQKAFDKAIRPYRRDLQLGTMKEEVAEAINRNLFLDYVLKGWSNVRDEDDKEIVYSRQAAESLIERLPDLYEELNRAANDQTRFLLSAREDLAKN